MFNIFLRCKCLVQDKQFAYVYTPFGSIKNSQLYVIIIFKIHKKSFYEKWYSEIIFIKLFLKNEILSNSQKLLTMYCFLGPFMKRTQAPLSNIPYFNVLNQHVLSSCQRETLRIAYDGKCVYRNKVYKKSSFILWEKFLWANESKQHARSHSHSVILLLHSFD